MLRTGIDIIEVYRVEKAILTHGKRFLERIYTTSELVEANGHTASLVPEDASLGVDDVDVTSAGPYQDRMRMTLTYPIINRAREIMWLLTGAGKTEMLNRMKAGDQSIPAGRVRQASAIVFADQAAAGASREF